MLADDYDSLARYREINDTDILPESIGGRSSRQIELNA